MSQFLVAEIKITNDAWVPAYAANVHKFVARHGGKYLSRSGNITTVEGQGKDCSLVAVMEFPSKTALQAFVNDPEYQPYVKARQAGSSSQFYMIDATDIAGTVPYLTAG
ncbi:MAG: DUF1330 domain-containing protein [Polaromonas sp.]|uniref:DUF1330 domain-containing protein n=1 Tax=Polaromonas sp. TaxID=1869339 RepID=UPI00248803A9|nr:DUF1330 domain-containing protein [Polaromonas sp.]MDI1240203.1 DUF1330 domain-containing protein [Polaromonas sp.]MDI1338576.1 DUF1330 domain-containing protein [Polaromonas sp.]